MVETGKKNLSRNKYPPPLKKTKKSTHQFHLSLSGIIGHWDSKSDTDKTVKEENIPKLVQHK